MLFLDTLTILKKAGVIAIGLFLAVFITGHFFIFKIAQLSHQDQFRSFILKNLDQTEKIEISPFELFSNSNNIKWNDNNKEIVFNGLVYDIVSIKNTGKTVSLFVVNDTDEKTLLDNYNELAGSIFNNSSPVRHDLIKDFLSLKFFQDGPLEITTLNVFQFNVYAEYVSDIITVFLSQETPPPNILF